MTARQQAQLVLAKGSIPGSVAFSQGFLRVRHKYTLRTEEDIAAYVRRIQSAIPGMELDNAFLNQKEFPFPSAIELWFRLSGEASRLLGTSPTPHAAEAPLVSPVGRIYRVGKRRRVHENVSGQERGSTVMAMPQGTEELETMQQETAGQQAPEQQVAQPTAATAAPTANGTEQGSAAPSNAAPAAGAAGRPPAQPLPEVVPGSEIEALLANKDLSDSEKARRLVQDHNYTIANAAKQLSITRGKPMRYQQVYQSLHGKEMRAARDVKQAGGTAEEVDAAREKARNTPLGTTIKEQPATAQAAAGTEPGPVGTNEGTPTAPTTAETGAEVESTDTGE